MRIRPADLFKSFGIGEYFLITGRNKNITRFWNLNNTITRGLLSV